MSKYIIKRILIAIPVLLGITIIDYAIMCLAGSPLEILQGPRISEAAVEAKRIALGLDKPIFAQFCNYGHFTHQDAPWEQCDRADLLWNVCRVKEAGVSSR